MFPVPKTSVAGATRNCQERSSASLEARYKELLIEGADLKADDTSTIGKKWATSKASSLWWSRWEVKENTNKPHNRTDNIAEEVPSPARQSCRKCTPRKPTLYEDL